MATYALTYATRAAFDTALASGDIYSLMQGVTSSQPSVAIAAHITESGETFSCGTNVMVDIKSVGPGDYVLYDSTNKKWFGIASKWIDNNYPSQPTQHILIFKAGVLPARFVVCGTVIKRFGNRIRLAGEGVSKVWSTSGSSGYAWDVPDLGYYYAVLKKSRTTTTNVNSNQYSSAPSLRYSEAFYPSGNATYWPILRSVWNDAVINGDTTVSGNGKTVTLSDYDNDYDRYLEYNWSPLFPANTGAYDDRSGKENTKKIVTNFVANHGKSATSDDYAAGFCYNYSISAPGLGKHNWFLGVIRDQGDIRALAHTLRVPLAWGTGYLWSATQNANYAAWVVSANGFTYPDTKNNVIYAIPLADLILET